jgi:signal transduction histidine kinase
VARLHSRIYLHFLGVLLVVALTTSVVVVVGMRDGFRREIAAGVTRHLGSLVGERIADARALDARLRQIHADLRLAVRVRGLDGATLAAVGEAVPPLTPAEDADVRAGRVVVRRHPPGLATAARDPSTGAIVGFVEASAPHHFGPPSLWPSLVLVTVALLVVAVATRPLAQRISRPIERLTATARRFGAGDLAARVPAGAAHARRADEITELTRAFNEMAERVERLVRAEKELLANVSHELRSPLARIRVALELLPRTADAEGRFRDVERDLAELDQLIDDVLTTARLEARSFAVRPIPFDARALLRELAERARHDPLTAGLELRVEDGAAVDVTADQGLLRRAVWNLVENAAKYGAPPIALSAARTGDRVLLAVADRGAGIAVEEREHVFAPFQRGAAAAAGAARGVGLGLTLARRIVEVHGGTIAIEGPPGCRVVVAIPRGVHSRHG